MSLPALQGIRRDLEGVEALIQKSTAVDDPHIARPLGRLLASGKRIRPALVILSSKFGNPQPQKVLSLAAAVELLHAATLIHDDMIDHSPLRRGRRTLNTRLPEGEVVLVGDYLFARAAALAAKAADSALIHRFADTAQKIVWGELREVRGKPWSLDREEYFKRISTKTAALFALSAEAGALIGGASEDKAKALGRYGFNLGMAFQIVDDILDFTASQRSLGKPTGSDLRQGLVTLPVLYFVEENPNWRNLAKILGDGNLQEERLNSLVDLIKSSPAISASQKEAQAFTDKAKRTIRTLPANPYRRALFDLADSLVLRGN